MTSPEYIAFYRRQLCLRAAALETTSSDNPWAPVPNPASQLVVGELRACVKRMEADPALVHQMAAQDQISLVAS